MITLTDSQIFNQIVVPQKFQSNKQTIQLESKVKRLKVERSIQFEKLRKQKSILSSLLKIDKTNKKKIKKIKNVIKTLQRHFNSIELKLNKTIDTLTNHVASLIARDLIKNEVAIFAKSIGTPINPTNKHFKTFWQRCVANCFVPTVLDQDWEMYKLLCSSSLKYNTDVKGKMIGHQIESKMTEVLNLKEEWKGHDDFCHKLTLILHDMMIIKKSDMVKYIMEVLETHESATNIDCLLTLLISDNTLITVPIEMKMLKNNAIMTRGDLQLSILMCLSMKDNGIHFKMFSPNVVKQVFNNNDIPFDNHRYEINISSLVVASELTTKCIN